MAVLPTNQFQDEDPNEKSGEVTPQPSAGGVVGAGAGQPGAGGRKTRAGGYVGIQNYLGAQGNAGDRLAQSVGSNITQQTNKATEAVGGVQNQFNQQADSNRVGDGAELRSQLSADPTKINQGAWEKATGGYKGPSDLTQISGYQDAAGKAQRATQALGQTSSGAGRNTLLRDQFGRPSYTGGQSRLDTAILGADTGARNRFQKLRNALGGKASGALTNAQQSAQEMGSQYQKEAQKTQGMLNDSLTSAREGLQSNLGAALLNGKSKSTSNYERALRGNNHIGMDDFKLTADELADREFAQKEFQRLGLTDGAYGTRLNMDQRANLLQNRGPQSFADVATDEQIARDSALARLASGEGYIQGDKGQWGLSADKNSVLRSQQSNKSNFDAQKRTVELQRLAREKEQREESEKKLALTQAAQAKSASERKAREQAEQEKAARYAEHLEGVRKHKQAMAAQGVTGGLGYTGR